jgi:iron complex outermembrane recepter protein
MLASFAKCSSAAVLVFATGGMCQTAHGIGLRSPLLDAPQQDASHGGWQSVRFYGAQGQGIALPASGSWSGGFPGTGLNIPQSSLNASAAEFGMTAPLGRNVSANLALFSTGSGSRGTDMQWRDGLAVSINGAWANGIGASIGYTTGRTLYAREVCAVLCIGSDSAAAPVSALAEPEQSVYGELSWRHARLGFRAGVEARYLSRRYADEFSSDSTTAYFNANAHVGIEQKIGAWRIQEFARVDNFTNRNYGGDGAYRRPLDFAPERSYLIGIRAGYSW